ncbi:TonB-dependent receptor domain-containing protein, partial [Herbaspirillum sp. B65]|uniref:TonB-dependent receptor domain-containing protein n=1 Tax=Herbaspirillum sp. B65 TaxID=137708 RepID=UPI0020906FA3
GVFLQANPNLKPEKVWSTELAIEKQLQQGQGKWRVSLFEERVADALISQSSTIGSGVASFTPGGRRKSGQWWQQYAWQDSQEVSDGASLNLVLCAANESIRSSICALCCGDGVGPGQPDQVVGWMACSALAWRCMARTKSVRRRPLRSG